MEKKILKREDIDKKYKWNLEEYYPNWEAWDRELEQTKELMKKVPEYKGKIKYSSEKFTEMIQLEEKIGRTIEKLYIYPYHYIISSFSYLEFFSYFSSFFYDLICTIKISTFLRNYSKV